MDHGQVQVDGEDPVSVRSVATGDHGALRVRGLQDLGASGGMAARARVIPGPVGRVVLGVQEHHGRRGLPARRLPQRPAPTRPRRLERSSLQLPLESKLLNRLEPPRPQEPSPPRPEPGQQ